MKNRELVLRIEKNRLEPGDGREDLFGPRDDWESNACLNFSSDDWDLYTQGYRRAAERLCKSVVDSRGDKIDSLVYPVLSLYRHYIELQIKHIVFSSRALLDQPVEIPMNHRLSDLWQIAEANLKTIAPEVDPRDIDRVRDAIDAIQGLDPLATAFRYPFDRDGQFSLPDVMHINLGRIYEELSAVGDIIDLLLFTVVGYLDLKQRSGVKCLW